MIHFAALKAVGDSVRDPLRYWKNNLDSTFSLVNKIYIDYETKKQNKTKLIDLLNQNKTKTKPKQNKTKLTDLSKFTLD